MYCMLALFITISIAANTIEMQQKMNAFQRAIKNTQNKLSLYSRCVKKQCTPQEKEEAYADLKTAAKIAIPTGIGLVVAIGGGTLLYKKFGPQIKLAKWYYGKKFKSYLPHNKKVAALKNAIYQQDNKFIQQELERGLDPKKYFIDEMPFVFYVMKYGSPEMFSMLINKYPELVNALNRNLSIYGDVPLLTEAFKYSNKANILLNATNINVRPNVAIENSPLFRAMHLKDKTLRERILAKYDKQSLEEDIQKIKASESAADPDDQEYLTRLVARINESAKNFSHLQ